MFYTIYEITNQINNKTYIGKHQTKNLNDNYMGSGKNLRYAIEKYGIEKFEKEILFQFDNEDEMNAKEAELVTEDFCLREDTYNLCPGGRGGWGYINTNNLNNSNKDLASISRKISAMKTGIPRPDISEKLKIAYIEKRKVVTGAFSKEGAKEMSKRAQSKEAKEKREKTRKETNFQQGSNNSQYGKSWIWHEKFGNKKIERSKISEYIEQGWVKTYKPGYRIEKQNY